MIVLIMCLAVIVFSRFLMALVLWISFLVVLILKLLSLIGIKVTSMILISILILMLILVWISLMVLRLVRNLLTVPLTRLRVDRRSLWPPAPKVMVSDPTLVSRKGPEYEHFSACAQALIRLSLKKNSSFFT